VRCEAAFDRVVASIQRTRTGKSFLEVCKLFLGILVQ